MSKRITYRCPECGSSNIIFDATAKWDEERQEFIALAIMDNAHDCADCMADDIDPTEATIE